MKIDKYRKNLIKSLVVFEAVLNVIFWVLAHLLDNYYLRGIGVGLLISWVTSAIAYYVTEHNIKG